jgi:hypothetical protein
MARIWLLLAGEFLAFAAILFGAAGTLAWPAGWAFMALFFVPTILITLCLESRDPALLRERAKPLVQRGQPLWTRP